MSRAHPWLGFIFVALFLHAAAASSAFPGGDALWYRADAPTAAERSVRLYLFWSSRCPHCTAALPFVEDLSLHYPWLTLEAYEIYEHAENRPRFQLMLLSLLVHARNRRRMLLVGGVFVFFSGLIYFLFMAAWLNAFRWLGEIQAVTVSAGLVSVLLGLVNIKDFFWFRRGVSLSLGEASRQHLLTRMRGLLRGDSLPAVLIGTVVLAVAANSYELLCTVGFPMVYTRILTLMLIVLVFVATLGARKLTEAEGRGLKLMSGLMMLGLGLLLLFAPQVLSNVLSAVVLMLMGPGWPGINQR